MPLLPFTILLFTGSIAAGLLGALTGLGGGVIIIPMLVLAFGVDLRYAVGASLASVIATSSGSAAAYVKEGYTNIRVGMFLEIATTIGALAGASLAVYVPGAGIAAVFGFVLLFTAWGSIRAPAEHPDTALDPLATRLRLNGSYPASRAEGGGFKAYAVHHVPAGFALMLLAGILSGLIGIGSGVIKVLAMDRLMRLPFKVSTTTSNFMIGVTAATGAGVYLARGQVDPVLCFPIILGTTAGSLLGTRVLFRLKTRTLRVIFSVVVAVLGLQMIYRGLKGGL